MTTNTTPDLTSTAWLGDLADELGPDLARAFTERRADLIADDFSAARTDRATRMTMGLVNSEVYLLRLIRRTADRPCPAWSVRAEEWTIAGMDSDETGTREHDLDAAPTTIPCHRRFIRRGHDRGGRDALRAGGRVERGQLSRRRQRP